MRLVFSPVLEGRSKSPPGAGTSADRPKALPTTDQAVLALLDEHCVAHHAGVGRVSLPVRTADYRLALAHGDVDLHVARTACCGRTPTARTWPPSWRSTGVP